MDMDCLFCRIVGKEIPVNVVFENEAVLAFLDLNPRAEGHTLVIPKSHFKNLLDLPSTEVGGFFEGVKKVQEILDKVFKPDGFTIGINQNQAAGQEVDHIHVHLIPRFLGDGGGSVQGVVDSPSKGSLEEVKEKIKKYG